MPNLKLVVLSLRYSSWSMRAWLVLTQAGAKFELTTVELPEMQRRSADDRNTDIATIGQTSLADRRSLGSVRGLFPVLHIDGVPIHETLAICEYVAESFPLAKLWPEQPLDRARARAISTEMVSGFTNIRNELSSHLFARVPGFTPSPAAEQEISRVFELWGECLSRSGGPFLFGSFGIADAMYFPMLGRFRTYGVTIPDSLTAYAEALELSPTVERLVALARRAPHVHIYDDYVRDLGGNPDAALAS